MTASLSRLVVRGLRSIHEAALDLTTDVTVLIGANGSGKSNLVSALELVSRIWDDSFQEYLAARGGIDNLLFRGEEDAREIVVELMSEEDSEGKSNGYHARLVPDTWSESGRATLSERLLFWVPSMYDKPYDEFLGSGSSSRIPTAAHIEDGRLRSFAEYVQPILDGCRVFHFDDVSAKAPVKGWSTVGDDLSLRRDAENIAAYLLKVKREHPQHYERIVSAIRHVTPFFDDFVLVPNDSERIRLRWRQRGLDRTFLAHEASDGTLRFICLATLLLGPDLPSTVVLDEPELGLHPAAIALLAEMTHIAGRNGHKVVIATQSVPLLAHYGLEEIAVLDRVHGATTLTRPDSSALEAFLEEYSTGALWEMNLLGGRPSAEGPSANGTSA